VIKVLFIYDSNIVSSCLWKYCRQYRPVRSLLPHLFLKYFTFNYSVLSKAKSGRNFADDKSSQRLSGTYRPERCAVGSDYNPSAGEKQHFSMMICHAMQQIYCVSEK